MINKLIELTNDRENKEELRQLIDYLKITMYLERKSTVLVKALLVYRLAYLKTYHLDLFTHAIDQLGYSKVSQIELKTAINQVKQIAKTANRELGTEELIKEVGKKFVGYVNWQNETFRKRIEDLIR